MLFAVAVESLFILFLTVFLFNHADPKGDGMEMVASSAAFMLIFLPLSLPAYLSPEGRFLILAALSQASPLSSISSYGSRSSTSLAFRLRPGPDKSDP